MVTEQEQVQQWSEDVASGLNSLRRKLGFYHRLLNDYTNAIIQHTYKLTLSPVKSD